jgi:superfamily II RNA helicase
MWKIVLLNPSSFAAYNVAPIWGYTRVFFQARAISCLERQQSVLVSAHTR